MEAMSDSSGSAGAGGGGGAAPNGTSSPAPQTEGTDRPSPEERLKALQDKTNAWKVAVAEQLKEAAAKNKALRAELKAAKESGEKDLVDLRVQLNKEFKERTAMLQEEVASLNGQVATLRQERTELAARHEAELQAAEARGRDASRVDGDMEQRAAEERHRAEIGRLTVALADKDREVSQAQHEASLLSARLERLGEQYAELSSLIHVDDGDATRKGAKGGGPGATEGHSTGTSSGLAIAVNDAAHQQQLENVRAELAGKEQQALRRLERARAEQEQERQLLVREVQSREERLAVLQELLRQSQSELSSSHQRISRVQADAQRLEQHYAAKVSSLSQELATQLEVLEEAQQTNRELERQLALAKEAVASLEEDAVSREEAFRSLMLSEDDKQLVRNLEAELHAAREEGEEWKMRYYHLQQEGGSQQQRQRQRQRRPGGGGGGTQRTTPPASQLAREEEGEGGLPPSQGETAAGVEDDSGPDDDHDERLLRIERREAELAEQSAQLEQRAAALRVAEVKLDGIKKSVAQQASMILSNNHGGGRHGSSGGGEAAGSSSGGGKNANDGSSGTGSGRGGNTLRHPALYFDSLSEEQSWLRWLVRVLRWAVSTRMRVLLLVSCVMIIFVVFVQLFASVRETTVSRDTATTA